VNSEPTARQSTPSGENAPTPAENAASGEARGKPLESLDLMKMGNPGEASANAAAMEGCSCRSIYEPHCPIWRSVAQVSFEQPMRLSGGGNKRSA
jgi:hypothetical protein